MDLYKDGEGNIHCDIPFIRIHKSGDQILIDDQLTLEEMEEIVAKMKELRAKNGD